MSVIFTRPPKRRRAGLNLPPAEIGLPLAEGHGLDHDWRRIMAFCDESTHLTYLLLTC